MRPWIAAKHGLDSNAARLFCFSHAGGGSSLFAHWRNALPEIEVCPVLLPGRETRLHEPSYRRMEDLIDPLMEALGPTMDRPFALFGHSMGAIVAFELARRATASALPIRLLMVSGRRAPHLRTRRPQAHLLDDREFLAVVEALNGTPKDILQDRGLMRVFLPSLRADFELNETYSPLPGRSLSCDIISMMGDADPEVDEQELVAWRELTSGAFSSYVLPGDHFYLSTNPYRILAIVRERLARAFEAA